MVNCGHGGSRRNGDGDAVGIPKDKVLHDQSDGSRAVTPKRVGDAGIAM
jgi:hypothetical protein